MTVYVDDMAIYKSNKLWFHLMSDEEDDREIHVFAAKIGLKRTWFQGDHYDIVEKKREHAIELGAIPVKPQKLVEIRRQKRANK